MATTPPVTTDSVKSDPVKALGYDEAIRNMTDQASVLEGLRGRGATLFSAAALITSFLGGLTLVAPALESGVFRGARIGDWAWAALIAFGFVGFTTLLILWPWDFGFVMDPVQFVNDAEAAQLEVDDLKGELTGFLWQHWNANQQKLGWL